METFVSVARLRNYKIGKDENATNLNVQKIAGSIVDEKTENAWK